MLYFKIKYFSTEKTLLKIIICFENTKPENHAKQRNNLHDFYFFSLKIKFNYDYNLD